MHAKMRNKSTYEKIPLNHDVSDENTRIDDDALCAELDPRLRNFPYRRLIIANCLLFCFSLFVFASSFPRSVASTAQFVERFSSYSPARSAVKYVSGTFNATQGMASGYIGTSNETDEMWEWVTVSIGDQMITPAELKLVEKPETSIKTTDPRTGKEGYRIGLEVFHQLHCLNLVRKSTFGDHYKGKGDFAEKDEKKLRAHIDHCLEMLRMNLMCQVDIGVITFHERPDMPGDPYPDFSTKHVCRDFDEIRNWAIENTVANDDIF